MEYRGLTLDGFQEQAVSHLRDGASVLVSAPTGTGKTLVADWIVDQALSDGKQVVYTAPVKALSNQKYRDYCRLHGEENVGLVTGDLVIRPDAPCRVMTTEILRNMLLDGQQMPELAAVVLDEIHFLDDPERGTVWEEVLIYLPESVQIVGLSATLSNLSQFAAWLSEVRKRPVEEVKESKRAVPMEIGFVQRDWGLVTPEQYHQHWKRWKGSGGQARSGGRRRGRRDRRHQRGRGREDRGERPTSHIDVLRLLEPDRLPVLFFVFSRKEAEARARVMGRRRTRSFLDATEQRRMDARLFDAVQEIGEAVLHRELAHTYSLGVGFHHAGLHVQLKALVEELYEQKLLKVLYTTSTFALGINMPARTVVLDGLRKFDGQEFRPLRVREFMQKAGRAGRRGMDEQGFVFVRLDPGDYEEHIPDVNNYLEGASEPVHSSFNLSFNSVVRLIERNEMPRVKELVSQSFLAWSNRSRSQRSDKRIAALRAELEAEGWSGDRYAQQPSQYLVGIGYLDEDDGFAAGARILRHIQISEIFTTELVLEGLVEELPDDLLYGIFCGMTGNLPRDVRLAHKPHGEARGAIKAVEQVRKGPQVTGAEAILGQEVTFTPGLVHFGAAWVNGRTLEELALTFWAKTDISGNLVGCFRRAKDLCQQVSEVYRDQEPATFERLRALARRVSRDEVEVVG